MRANCSSRCATNTAKRSPEGERIFLMGVFDLIRGCPLSELRLDVHAEDYGRLFRVGACRSPSFLWMTVFQYGAVVRPQFAYRPEVAVSRLSHGNIVVQCSERPDPMWTLETIKSLR